MSHSAFHDLFDKETADLMVIKANILIEIEKIIEENNISRRNLEKILDIPQPQVSDLITKKFHKISVDRLLKYLNRLIEFFKIKRVIKMEINVA